jgi:hypothetical protein
MVLPGSGILSVQAIENEWLIGTAITKKLNGDLGPLIAILPTVTTSIGSFYGKAYARAVTSITQGTTTTSSIILNWSGGAGATSFSITSTPSTTTQTASGSGYNFTGLAASTTYTFTIVSKNAQSVVGQSATSGSFVTSTPTPVSGSPIWTARAGDGNNQQGKGIGIDSLNNIYIGGDYPAPASITFYNSSGTTFGTLPNIGVGAHTFAAKYNSSGTVQWITKSYAVSDDITNGVCVDDSGNMYICGNHAGTMSFYNSNGTLFPSSLGPISGMDSYVVKYNSSGAVQWITRAGSLGTIWAYAIAVDTSGNIYVTGRWIRTTTFYNSSAAGSAAFSPTLTQSPNNYDVFIVKYNSSGAVQWVAKAGTITPDIGAAITVDTSGNVYLSGFYSGLMTIYNSSAAGSTAFATTLAQIGGNDVFIIKYNTSGAVQWVARAGSAGADNSTGIAVDTGGNVYMTGYYAGTMTFYNSSAAGSTAFATTLAQIGSNDVFVAKYNTSGAVQWVARAGTSTGSDIGYAITVDTGGNVYITGYYLGVMTFYNATGTAFGTTLNTFGTVNGVFIAKYNTSGAVQWVSRAGCTQSAGTETAIALAIRVGGGYVYVTGYYTGTMIFYDASGAASSSLTLSPLGANDVFLVKYLV